MPRLGETSVDFLSRMSYKRGMTKAVGRSPVNPRARDPRETDGVLPNWADPARTMVFFGLGFAYLWLWVKPALIASCGTVTNFPVFYKGWPFFFETVRTPGGFLQYVSAFASQMFYFSWAGAAVPSLPSTSAGLRGSPGRWPGRGRSTSSSTMPASRATTCSCASRTRIGTACSPST